MEKNNFLRIMGSSWWIPCKGDDCACYLINDHILVDTGWYSVHNMLELGINPANVDTVLLTHTHCDHYLGLAHLIMYWRTQKATLKGLTILGPEETVRAGFERSLNYILHDSRDLHEEIAEMPKIVEMSNNSIYKFDHFTVESLKTIHAVPGVVYRITDDNTGAVICFTGDTAYRPEYGEFFHDCDILIHECSMGVGPTDPVENKYCLHSSATDAGIVAKASHAKRMLMVHTAPERREACVEKAKSISGIPVEWPEVFKKYEF